MWSVSGFSIVSYTSIPLPSLLSDDSPSPASTGMADQNSSLVHHKHCSAATRLFSSEPGLSFSPFKIHLKLFHWVLLTPAQSSFFPVETGVPICRQQAQCCVNWHMIKNPKFSWWHPAWSQVLICCFFPHHSLCLEGQRKTFLVPLSPYLVISKTWSVSWLPLDFLLQFYHCLPETSIMDSNLRAVPG